MEEQKVLKIRMSTIILIIIIVLLLGALTYLLFTRNNNNQNNAKGTLNVVTTNSLDAYKENNALGSDKINVTNQDDKTSQAEKNKVENGKMSQDMMDLFEQYLGTDGNINFLMVDYKSISDIDVEKLFRYDTMHVSYIASETELKEMGKADNAVPVHIFTKVNVENYFKSKTGEDISILKKPIQYTWKNVNYLNETSDWFDNDIHVTGGYIKDNIFVIDYTGSVLVGNNGKKNFEVTLKKVDGKFIFVSNIMK